MTFDKADGSDGAVAVTNGAGIEVAAGSAGRPVPTPAAVAPPDAGAYPWVPRPDDLARPPASPEVLTRAPCSGAGT